MPEQMILWPDDEFDGLKGDRRLELLKKIDISQFIPQDVYNYYYQDTGRPPFTLESMLLALLVQKIFKVPTIELLITFIDFSPILKRLCGFNRSIPDESTFCRFKQRLGGRELQKNLNWVGY